ncbi:hypothetical protein POM88_003085 [Heracleum sosnowskyi]|uniref:Uncharacterized protein n=1 Tax=Heracleum sosnowskyi TaxID=360622 RepID=A0AAD8JJX5_9APIA|nr:hypothetical protein POM88_003085 [Heracleum sosnowskyi]
MLFLFGICKFLNLATPMDKKLLHPREDYKVRSAEECHLGIAQTLSKKYITCGDRWESVRPITCLIHVHRIYILLISSFALYDSQFLFHLAQSPSLLITDFHAVKEMQHFHVENMLQGAQIFASAALSCCCGGMAFSQCPCRTTIKAMLLPDKAQIREECVELLKEVMDTEQLLHGCFFGNATFPCWKQAAGAVFGLCSAQL